MRFSLHVKRRGLVPTSRMIFAMVVFGLQSETHRDTPVDIFLSEPFDFDSEYEAALVGELAPGIQARFVRLETLIAMKEAANREKDREDVRQLKIIAGESE